MRFVAGSFSDPRNILASLKGADMRTRCCCRVARSMCSDRTADMGEPQCEELRSRAYYDADTVSGPEGAQSDELLESSQTIPNRKTSAAWLVSAGGTSYFALWKRADSYA